METDVKRILLHLANAVLDDHDVTSELARDHMILIESARTSLSPECYAAAAATVRATAYSADASGDRLRQFVQELERL